MAASNNSQEKKQYQMSNQDLLFFCIKNTNTNFFISMDEFREELTRFRSLRRLFNAYASDTREIDLRIFVSHFIVLSNIFPLNVLIQLLFSEIPDIHWSQLKTFLLWLNYLRKETKIIKLPTKPQVIVKLNKINIDKCLLNKLNETLPTEKYIRKNAE